MLGVALATATTVWVRHLLGGNFQLELYARLWPFIPMFAFVFLLSGLYSGIALDAVTELKRTTTAATLSFLMLATLTFMSRQIGVYSRLIFVAAWLQALVLVPWLRSMARHYLCRCAWWGYPVAVFGSGKPARDFVRCLLSNPQSGLKPVALVDGSSVLTEGNVPVVTKVESGYLRSFGVKHAVVVRPDLSPADLLHFLETEIKFFPHVLVVPALIGLSTITVEIRETCRVLTLHMRRSLLLTGPQITKRCLDILLVLGAAIFALPAIAILAALVRLDSRGPAFFSQTRIGRGQLRFRVWKLRTMSQDADRMLAEALAADPELLQEWQTTRKLRYDPRLTRMGRFLRKTSLDELPQLWNILLGDMSLVGPRPICEEEITRYGHKFPLYTKVVPGLTGLWQVSGRNDTSYDERVELDTYYVRNWSPWLDFYLLARTIRVVLTGAGAY
jgi:Undecaprenyl-phosphate galactose phosphotransferase WbaP